MNRVMDCMEHADKCQALADATSDPTHRQKCLAIAKMWRDTAKTRLDWLYDIPALPPGNVPLPVP